MILLLEKKSCKKEHFQKKIKFSCHISSSHRHLIHFSGAVSEYRVKNQDRIDEKEHL